jgi:MFS superfamily sulfate permease-like transporter
MKNYELNFSTESNNYNNANLNYREDALLPINYLKNKKTLTQKIYENIKPGMSVGLLNLALCISIPVASDCNPEQGILAGIIAGIISGFLSGSKFNIIGPSGTLSGIVSGLVLKYGIQSIPIFTFASGVIALIFKYLNFENEIDLIPVEVNEGFKLGVAFLLFYTQIYSAVGFIKIKGEENSCRYFLKILDFIIY